MVRNVHTPGHVQCVCRNVISLNQAKITKDGFDFINFIGLQLTQWFGGFGFVLWVGVFLLCGRFLVYVEPSLEFLDEKHARLSSANLEMRIVGIILACLVQAEQDQSPDFCFMIYEMLVS